MSQITYIPTADVLQVAWEAVRSYQVDFLGSLADPSACGMAPGVAWADAGEGPFKAPYDEPLLAPEVFHQNWCYPDSVTKGFGSLATPDGSLSEKVHPEKAKEFLGLCPSRIGHEAVKGLVEGLVHGMEHVLMEKIFAHKHSTPSKPGLYRLEAMRRRNVFVGDRVITYATAKLKSKIITRHRAVTGVKKISSCSKKIPPVNPNTGFVWFKYSGKWAIRSHQGREALPKSVWLAHYIARLKKRNKSGQDRGGGKNVKFPKTKYDRPRKSHDLKTSKAGGYFQSVEPEDLLPEEFPVPVDD